MDKRKYGMKRLFSVCLQICFCMVQTSCAETDVVHNNISADLIQTSQKILLAAKRHETTDSLADILNTISISDLGNQLPDDNHKKAFWINLYNAYTQILLTKNPGRYQNRASFFGSRQIRIAGKELSLDDIEHGILRRSKIKWGLGYINKPFPSQFEKKLRVDTVDYRIHFSLNCGAKSCPPIAFYQPEQLNKQLDIATKTYLKDESDYQISENSIYLPAMMSWFRGDFGGKQKMKELLHRINVLAPEQNPNIKFKKYDWNLFLENYKTD